MQSIRFVFLAVVFVVVPIVSSLAGAQTQAAVHFASKTLPFILDGSESPEKHAPETMAGGVAAFDYDNDGYLDIFLANGADIRTLKKTSAKYSNRLFHNNHDGTFTDVTEKAGLTGTGFDVGIAIGDYDNDGYEDIFVGGIYRNTLYHNNGNGTFTDITEKAGLSTSDREFGALWSVGGAWLDVNNDGLLDLFVVNYMRWDVNHEPQCEFKGKPEYCHPKFYKELPNQLFLNKGNGTFQDISVQSGIRAHLGKGMGVAIADYDHDGLPDIFVANDKLFNSLFHNRKGKDGLPVFEEVAFDAGVALPERGNMISGMGLDFRDLNNDGYADISIVALEGETFPVYFNNTKGGFDDVTGRIGMTFLTDPMAGFGSNIADYDNDGWKDIFVSRGHVQSLRMVGQREINQPNTVFHNQLGQKFSALTAEAGFTAQPPARHRGSAVADFNHDGKLDLVVTALAEPAELWINDSPEKNNWLEIALEGTESNRDGIGASIKVVAGGKSQFNNYSTASGYGSSSAGPVHFGLGSAKGVDEIEIQWPSGIRQVIKNPRLNEVLHVKEPAAGK